MVQYNGNSREALDIIICADAILSTPYGSMPYMRDMGITSNVLRAGLPEMEGEYFNQAVDQIEMWEERASVSEIIMAEQDGKIIPKVVIEDGE